MASKLTPAHIDNRAKYILKNVRHSNERGALYWQYVLFDAEWKEVQTIIATAGAMIDVVALCAIERQMKLYPISAMELFYKKCWSEPKIKVRERVNPRKKIVDKESDAL